MTSGPQLLVNWEPRWHGFVTSIAPALQRSPARLGYEVEAGLRPRAGGAASLLLHVITCIFLLTFPVSYGKLTSNIELRPSYVSNNDVIYYAGPLLPKTSDVGGAESGVEGRAGGREAFHPNQTIKVSRGGRLTEQVVDAPKLRLPMTTSPVANLVGMATAPDPGPVPIDGVHSARRLDPSRSVVEPAPDADLRARRSAHQLPDDVVQAAIEADAARSFRRLSSSSPEVVRPAIDAADVRNGKRIPQIQGSSPVEPPVSAPASDTARLARLMLPARPVEPAPGVEGVRGRSVRLSGIAGTALGTPAVRGFGNSSDAANGDGTRSGGANGTSAGGGPASGSGASHAGPGDAGVANGTSGISGLIISAKPGNIIGIPVGAGDGSLVMSPNGSGTVGRGGSGAGNGIGKGSGPGSGRTGFGPGSGTTGTGPGNDVNARGGISLAPGPGGTGNGNTTLMAGVDIAGGSSMNGTNVINIPSFGDSATPPNVGSPSLEHGPRSAPAITIVGSPRSGGGMNMYGRLRGSRVYTIYFTTSAGSVVLQYSDPQSVASGFESELTAPELMRSAIPAEAPKERLVVACTIDRSGSLRNVQLVESLGTDASQKMLAAIQNWRFRPVLRRGYAIEVDAILGLDVDTR